MHCWHSRLFHHKFLLGLLQQPPTGLRFLCLLLLVHSLLEQPEWLTDRWFPLISTTLQSVLPETLQSPPSVSLSCLSHTCLLVAHFALSLPGLHPLFLLIFQVSSQFQEAFFNPPAPDELNLLETLTAPCTFSLDTLYNLQYLLVYIF